MVLKMANDYVSYLPVDNGDSILIKAGQKSVLTDLHYRKDDEAFDIKPDIKNACSNSILDYFVLTHTDKDHIRGFDQLFHCGKPSAWKSEDSIRVDTIICSQYVLDLTNPTEIAKPLVKEIKRRNRLPSADKKIAGNKLIIVDDGQKITVNTRLTGYVLSPSKVELENADPKAEQDSEANNTSIVIRWEYQQDGGDKTNILLGGDSEHEVWSRLNKKSSTKLSWHLVTAPHHCSLTPFAYKKDKDSDYTDDEEAISALSHRKGKGFVVASSKPIKRDSDNPPHYKAKNKWLKILRTNEKDTPEKRFFCTATHENDKPAVVKFELTKKGIKTYSDEKTSRTESTSSLNKPTRYG